MNFQPFVLGTGLSGWGLLQATLNVQKSTFNQSRPILSDSNHFLEHFSSINTPEDIVSDRRILRVVLGAYGLSDDVDNKHFIQTLLSEGASTSEALANKMSDSRYRFLVKDFDFSTNPPNHKLVSDLARKTVESYQTRSFERKIGDSDVDMRLALGFSRDLQELMESSSSNSAAWYQLLAIPPLRQVIQTALGLPREFAQLDIDVQHERIQERTRRVFGTSEISELASEQLSEQITRRFLIMRQAEGLSGSTSLKTALVLLSAIPKQFQ